MKKSTKPMQGRTRIKRLYYKPILDCPKCGLRLACEAKTTRKLMRAGSSLVLVIPKEFLQQLKINEGDQVAIKLYLNPGGYEIRAMRG